MYKRRLWSVRHAGWLERVYHSIEFFLSLLHPLFKRIGYARVDALVMAVEKPVKKTLFESRSCGQCELGGSGLSCPMNCPKSLRNGPCGGVRMDGTCEVKPDMPCVWVLAWQGSQSVRGGVEKIQVVKSPLDRRLAGTSAWLREVRRKKHYDEPAELLNR